MSEADAGTPPPAASPAPDPEAFVLRGAPRPVVRFRRGLIVGLAAAAAGGVSAVAWLALEPPSFRAATEEDAADPAPARSAPDALAGTPSSYGEVPRLGPPLPGDLGRPILEHQRSLAEETATPVRDGPAAPDAAAAAAEAERQRAAAAREAALGSAVMVPLGAAGRAPSPPSGAAAPAPVPAPVEPREEAGSEAGQLRPSVSPWTLSAGTVIPASLVTGLNSDLPGTVVAQVTENVRDSATGRTVLVPQGARLIGSYESKVAFGQRRALLVWQRIVFPGGGSVALENLAASDTAGYAGVADGVDFHTWRLLKGIALSTLLGVGTELSLGSGEGDLVRAVRESAQRDAARAGEQMTQRNLDIKPTLTVRPGWPVRAVLHHDLVLQPWRG